MALLKLGLSAPERRSEPLENPNVPLSSSPVWQFVSGGNSSDAGELVTPHSAMQLGAVNGCVNLIADSISSAPLRLYRRVGTGKEEAADNPLQRLLAIEPNFDSSAMTLWHGVITSMLLQGNGFIEIIRDGNGVVNSLWLLDPRQTTVKRQSDGNLIYTTSETRTRNLAAPNVLHIPMYTAPDGVMGISVLQSARNLISGGISMDKFGHRFFANNATPSGILTTSQKVRATDKTQMREDWEAIHSGTSARRVGVVDQDLKYQQISINQEDSQFLESKKLSIQQICGLFRVHPSQIGDISRVAGETYQGQQLTFLRDCLRPIMNRITQELIRKLLPNQSQYLVAYDVRDFLKLDAKTQMESLMTARQAGLLTTDEGREMAGLNPIGGEVGSLILAPANMCDARLLIGKSVATPTTAGIEETDAT